MKINNITIGLMALIVFILLPVISILLIFIMGIPAWYDGLSKPNINVVFVRETTSIDSLKLIDVTYDLKYNYYIEISSSKKYINSAFDMKLYCSTKQQDFVYPDDVTEWENNVDIKEPLVFINGMKYLKEVNGRYHYAATFKINETNEKLDDIERCLRCKVFFVPYFAPQSESEEFIISRNSIMFILKKQKDAK